MPPPRPRLLALAALPALASAASVPAHDFSSGAAMLWADYSPAAADFPLSRAALADLAARYRVHSLEQCFGCPWGSADGCVPLGGSEAHIVAAARGLKAANASAHVLMYVQTQMPRSCYASNAAYMARVQDWALRYDAGAYAGGIVPRNSARSTAPPAAGALDDNTFLDPRADDARAWWVAQAWAAPGAEGAIDGVYADRGEYTDWFGAKGHNISVAATAALSAARLAMLAAAQARGTVVYNGFDTSSRYAPDWNADTLSATDGANVEHWGAFECILPDGSMNTTMFGALMGEVFAAGALYPEKSVLLKAWPGPVVAPVFFLPEAAWGPHRMSPSWPGNATAPAGNATTPLSAAARSAALRDYFPFAFATFLVTAHARSYLHYAWWYDLCDGTSPVCAAPSAWADLGEWLDRPLGAPRGAPTVAGTAWRREFERCTVSVDIADWFSATFEWS